MKITVLIPHDLLGSAETAARRQAVSRSQFYATAIAEFLRRQETDSITERLNEVYAGVSAKVDPALHRAQLLSLNKDCW